MNLSKVGDGIGSLGKGAIGGIGSLGKGAVSGIGSLGKGAVSGIGTLGKGAIGGLGELGKGAVSGIGTLGTGLGDGFGKLGELTGIKGKKSTLRGGLTDEDKLKPNPNFKNYKDNFENLIKMTSVKTKYPLVSMQITYDSKKALAVTKQSDQLSYIKMYDLEEPHACTFVEQIKGTYIKVKEVEQNTTGKKFCVAYNDDGHFKVRIFD